MSEKQLEKKENQQNSESKAYYHGVSLCSILLNLLLGYLFLKYSYVHNRECFYLGGFAYWFGLIIFWTSIIIIIVVWPCQCCRCVSKEFSDNLFNTTLSVQTNTYFIFLIAFTIIIFFKEPCGTLRTFVIIYLLIIYSILFLSCLIGGIIWGKSNDKGQQIKQKLSEDDESEEVSEQ